MTHDNQRTRNEGTWSFVIPWGTSLLVMSSLLASNVHIKAVLSTTSMTWNSSATISSRGIASSNEESISFNDDRWVSVETIVPSFIHSRVFIDTTSNHTGNDDEDSMSGWWWKNTTSSAASLAEDLISLEENHEHDQRRHEDFNCGYWKCYAPSASHPGYGYVIGQRRNILRPPSDFAAVNIDRAYKLALDLERAHGIRHFLKSPSIIFQEEETIASTMALKNRLNSALKDLKKRQSSSYEKKVYEPFRTIDPKHAKRDKYIVQVVQSAPQPHVLVRLEKKHHDPVQSIYKELLLHQYNGTDAARGRTASERRQFLLDFQSTWKTSWTKMASAYCAEPRLYQDFQILVDSNGQIWQIDMDRVWGNPETESERIINETKVERLLIEPVHQHSETLLLSLS